MKDAPHVMFPAPGALVAFVAIAALSALTACGSGSSNNPSVDAAATTDGSGGGNPDAPSGEVTDFVAPGSSGVTDFAAPGSSGVTESTSSVTATNNCTLEYTLFEPAAGGASAPLVVLGHGFSRSQAQMADIARHIASHGMRVVTPDFCHLSAADTDHVANGADAVALSNALASGGEVVHIGYSAGGLAAIQAARDDANAVGYVGLDMVDADDLAVAAAGSLTLPAFGVLGEPSMCNSSNNGTAAYTAGSITAVRIPGATHCDFEEPTGGLCTTFCGAATGAVATAKALAAAFAAVHLGVDASGSQWIEPGGSEFDRLVSAGTIVPL